MIVRHQEGAEFGASQDLVAWSLDNSIAFAFSAFLVT